MSSYDQASATIPEIKSESPRRVADCEAIIIGAGPYGLSAAAHLTAAGVKAKVFGKPMEFWAKRMPAGMLLRSPRVASNISDPHHAFTLDVYERSAGIQPEAPLPLETFVRYGQWFRRQFESGLDERNVKQVDRVGKRFAVTLEDGEVLSSNRVIVAAGIGPFQSVPAVFASLQESQVSHCYQGCDVQSFSGRRVAVIGAGQSALESAALLAEAGADVELIARIPVLRWIGQHPRLHRLGPISKLLYSQHDVGPAGISRLVAAPKLMRCLPMGLRDKIRKRAVRPAGSRWLPARLQRVKISTGRSIAKAVAAGPDVELSLDDGSRRVVDHVLLGTGYAVNIARYGFLSTQLVGEIELNDGYPELQTGFKSSVPGLHFIGANAARTFGPLLYFVAGTEFASTELASYVAANRTVR